MNSPMTIERSVHFERGRKAQRKLKPGAAPSPMPTGTTPRIAKLMALALHFDEVIRAGQIADLADLARLGRVSRARVTQIMNLLSLAPDLQEELLFLPPTTKGRDPIRELTVRPICAIVDWRKQRAAWNKWRSNQSTQDQ